MTIMLKPIFVLNGPNLNLLGERGPAIYGSEPPVEIEHRCVERSQHLGMTVDFRQTNYEGALVDYVHEAREQACGIIINPAVLGRSDTSSPSKRFRLSSSIK